MYLFNDLAFEIHVHVYELLRVNRTNGDKEIIAVALLDGGAQSSLGTEGLLAVLR